MQLNYEGSGVEGMQLCSPLPVHRGKQANVGLTPAPIKQLKMQSGQGSGPPPQGGGVSPPLPEGGEVDDAAGKSSTGEQVAVEQGDFDAAIPSTPAGAKVRGEESKGGEDDTPN